MSAAWKVVQFEAQGDCPPNYRGHAVIWVTLSGKWERLPIAFNGKTAEIAAEKARAHWQEAMDRVAKNKARKGTGRREEFTVAPAFFAALSELSDAMEERTDAILSQQTDATDQRGFGLREQGAVEVISEKE